MYSLKQHRNHSPIIRQAQQSKLPKYIPISPCHVTPPKSHPIHPFFPQLQNIPTSYSTLHPSLLNPIFITPLLLAKDSLDLANPLPHHPKHRRKSKAPTPDPHRINEKVDQRPITDAERQEDAKVSPFILRLNIQRRQIINTRAILTVPTVRRSIWVCEVTRRARNKGRSIRRTCRARRRIEIRCFSLGAHNRLGRQRSSEDAADPVG